MREDVKVTDLKSKISDSINGTAEDARQRMLKKQAEYDALMKKMSVFSEFKDQMYSKLKSATYNNSNSLESVQAQYKTAYDNYSSLDIEISAKRSSLMDSIFYSGKMNSSAIIANSILS